MKLVPTKSVDSVMGLFTGTIKKLQTIATERYNEAQRLDDKIAHLEAKQDYAIDEAKKAEQFAAKLEALIT